MTIKKIAKAENNTRRKRELGYLFNDLQFVCHESEEKKKKEKKKITELGPNGFDKMLDALELAQCTYKRTQTQTLDNLHFST